MYTSPPITGQFNPPSATDTSFDDGGMFKEMRDWWMTAIKAGKDIKDQVYGRGAYECKQFFLGDHGYLFDKKYIIDQMYLQIGSDSGDSKPSRIPKFKISDNWAAKYVQTYSPFLTQGTMVRSVRPSKPFVPPPAAYGVDDSQVFMVKAQMFGQQYVQQQQMAMMKMQGDFIKSQQEAELRSCKSDMLQRVSNYLCNELGVPAERTKVVEDALIFGYAGYMTQMVDMPETNQSVSGSMYVGPNDIIWDPDAVCEKDAKWLAVECRCPAWQFSRLYGVDENAINCQHTSYTSDEMERQLIIRSGGPANHKSGVSADEVVYYKVWSRMGSGCRLQDKGKRSPMANDLDSKLGEYCFFIVTDCIDYPANYSPAIMGLIYQATMAGMDGGQLLQQACQWPIKYYLDVDDPWPITTLGFHARNGSPYPVPPLEFALSYLKFMVWIISFVADKCVRANRDIWVCDDIIAKELIAAIESDDDEMIVRIKGLIASDINKFVQILSAPELKMTILEIYQFFERKAEQATAMNDLIQASLARSMRTATEAQVIADASQLRPNAMAQRNNQVDTRVMRKEVIASITKMRAKDVQPILGDTGAMVWDAMFKDISPMQALREAEYECNSSQGRTLDLNTRQDQSNKMAQLVLPLLIQLAQATGTFQPVNAIIKEWAAANQIDPDLVAVFPDMPPPMPAPPKGVASQPSDAPKG